jgi:outer membrane protein assembly factor BamE (lipoprotein component of BamABCDE complex)
MRVIINVLILSLLVSCQSPQKRIDEFNKVHIGMVKSEVIAVAGHPYWSDRKMGQDRWIYFMNPKDREDERIVYFENNKVVEMGLRNQSLFSADELEQIKSQNTKQNTYKIKFSDKELKIILQKEVEKNEKKLPENFEKI